MVDRRCLNCDGVLTELSVFCPRCAQRTDTGRLSFGDVARDAFQTFTNVERGPLAFAWALLTRPGAVAREYVDGKRRRHFGPFATLLVLVGLAALAINVSGFQVLARDGLTTGPTELLQRHFNLLLLVQVPLLATSCWLVFRSEHLRVPEHMVLSAYTAGVRAIFLALAALLSMATSDTPGTALVYAFWGAWYVYFGWAASQFYLLSGRSAAWLRGIIAAALGHAGIIAVLFVGDAAYHVFLR